MKNSILLFLAFILTACASTPQVTVTLPPPTDTPIPTPTLHPQFIELQEQIASTGGRFTLNPDGHIYDSETAIPDITVAPDETMTLMVNNEEIVLDKGQVSFSDETGISIEGYEDKDGDGDYEPKAETVTINGVTMTLGEEDENGVKVVTGISVEGNYTEEQKAEKLAEFDATSVGFAPDATVLIMDGKYPKIVSAEDHTKVIAEWNFGKSDMVWDWSQMIDPETGDNVIFNIAKTWEMKGVNEVDKDGAESDSAKIADFAGSDQTFVGRGVYIQDIYLVGGDGKGTIGAVLKSKTKVETPAIAASGEIDGIIYFIDKNGELVRMRVNNLSCRIRYWH
ncbi:MAG: hypothetical protein HYZ22_01290 [Chloroflexi bacterium]|nr:hypothetical protein [Chloroflexota bacterium]